MANGNDTTIQKAFDQNRRRIEEKLWQILKQLERNTEVDLTNPIDFQGEFIPRNWETTSKTARSETTTKQDVKRRRKISKLDVPATNWGR